MLQITVIVIVSSEWSKSVDLTQAATVFIAKPFVLTLSPLILLRFYT